MALANRVLEQVWYRLVPKPSVWHCQNLKNVETDTLNPATILPVVARLASFPRSHGRNNEVRGRRREPGDYCVLPARPDPKEFVGSG